MIELVKLIDVIVGFATPVVQNSLQRSELVIKLLKQLNLDPDHPPADFTAVYQYTLVEYGIGKPKPVLEIFRQAGIQEIFRKALDQNSGALLLQEGDRFLSNHPLGEQIQALGIDAKREFYQFATLFIEVAKRTRTPAEVLTNQKLESLHQQIGLLQERLTRLPTLEGMRTELARLASLSLPIAALSSEKQLQEGQSKEKQCRAFALAQQMKGWFETLGYRFEAYEVWQDDYFEWVVNIPVRRGRYDRILVRGMEGAAEIGDVGMLRQSVEQQWTDEGWLVTTRRISRAARDEVEKSENAHLGCYTLDELLDQDADFSGYLNWLETEIQRRQIAEKYVPLACTKEELDPVTQQRIAVSRYDKRDGWIDGYIDQWLDDPAKEHISILGEFGTGKTWFALHYAWVALQRYQEAQKRGVDRPRLPLVIPLRDYAKAVSVESLFSEFFFRKHEIPIPGYSAFEQLNRMGKLLLIFDGFDEMAARVDRQEMINNFWELAKIVVPGSKVSLTCRTEHFPEVKEGRSLLNAELKASTINLNENSPQFEVLELEKFNDEQIQQVLSLQSTPEVVHQVMGNLQLLDLARRPVMTELILEALPDIEAGKPVDMSRVYLYAVRRKMERDIKAERTFTSLADKLYFLCELSWEMLSSDRMSLNYREFPDRIRKLFGAAVQEEKDLDHWHYDMMGQTMLIRNADGDYTPAHRSLLEFFVAYKFAAELGALAPDFLELMQGRLDLDGRFDGCEHTWSEYFQQRNDQVAPLKEFVSEKLEVLRQSVGAAPFSKAVLDLLVPILVPFSSEVEHPLMRILQSIQGKTQHEINYVGGNVTTLLIKLNKSILGGKDLTSSVILKADLTDANLRYSNLSHSDLSGSIFAKTSGGIWSIALSDDDQQLITGDATGRVHIWEPISGRKMLEFTAHKGAIRALQFLPKTKLLFTAAADNLIKLWDVTSQTCLKIFHGHTNMVLSISPSPDGKMLASGSADQTVKLWDTETCECITTFKKYTSWVRSVSYSPDGQLIAIGWRTTDKGNSIELWDIDSGECQISLQGHTKSVMSLAFDASGKFLASGSRDGTVRLWDINSAQCLYIFQDHFNSVNSVAFNSSGKVLASTSSDKTVKLWNTENGKCLSTLHGHNTWVSSVVFSHCNDIIISSTPKEVKVWNVEHSTCLNTLSSSENNIDAVVFHPSGKMIASCSADQTVKTWDLSHDIRSRTLSEHSKWVTSCLTDKSIRG